MKKIIIFLLFTFMMSCSFFNEYEVIDKYIEEEEIVKSDLSDTLYIAGYEQQITYDLVDDKDFIIVIKWQQVEQKLYLKEGQYNSINIGDYVIMDMFERYNYSDEEIRRIK